MIARPRTTSGARGGQHGFTLITVLIAIFLFGFGLLAILRSLGSVTSSATQNENVATTASLSNAFWGVVQANPALVDDPAFVGTYSASNITSAPAALQGWLYTLTDSTLQKTGLPPTGLPGGKAKIEKFADTAGLATPCAAASGCSVKLTLSWSQVASNGAAASTRSQIFYYQFGL